MIARMRPWMVVGMALLGALAVVGEARAKHLGLNGVEDFQEIARQGFFETINGAVGGVPTFATNPYIPATDPPEMGRQMNSYTYSSLWFKGKYYVGIMRNVGCFLGLLAPTDPSCSQPPGQPGLMDRGEIWAYTPDLTAGTGGTLGSWTMALQSPCIVTGGGFLVSACGGLNLGGLNVPPNLPRDLGYRGMTESRGVQDLPLDATARMWVGTMGIGGRILWSTTGTTFNVASINGLDTIAPITSLLGFSNLSNLATADLGYRSILFWNGRLCAAPTGSIADEDLPINPVVLCNNNPANTGAPWQTILNVKTDPNVGDPNHLGVFNLATFNGALYAGITNRTSGVAIARATAAAGCPLPSTNTTPCSLTWEKVIVDGGGRQITSSNLLPDSAIVSDMTVFNNALYVSVTDAAAFQDALAELFRINADGTWDLIMGRPRLKSLMDAMNADPTLAADFYCSTPNVNGVANFSFGNSFPGPVALGTQAACFPLSNMGVGFGAGANASPSTTGFIGGTAGYVWRMVVHDDGSENGGVPNGPYLYGGTLDLSDFDFGADLRRSKDGVTWTTANVISMDGLRNRSNYGIRFLDSVEDWPGGPALPVGTANPFTNNAFIPYSAAALGVTNAFIVGSLGYTPTGGAEVHVGTCAPNSQPVAVASVVYRNQIPGTQFFVLKSAPGQVILFDATNNIYVAFDDDTAGHNSLVDVNLDGTDSYESFCGDLIHYDWYQTDAAGPTGTITGTVASGDLVPPAKVPLVPVINLPTGLDYFYRLCVNDASYPGASTGRNCKDVTVRASYNLPPVVKVTTDPAATISSGVRRVQLVDLDGDGFGSLTLNADKNVNASADCSDPEALGVTCVWSGVPGVTIANPNALTTTATVALNNTSSPNIILTATDNLGYQTVGLVRVRVRSAVHDMEVRPFTGGSDSPVPAAGTEDVAQNVDVRVRNLGDLAETSTITLVDATGGTVTPSSQPVTNLAAGATTTFGFSWTPTTGSNHTLTATVQTVAGETSTANNTRSIVVAVTPGNDAPVANNDAATTTQNSAGIIIPVLTNDTDEEDVHPPTVDSITQSPANGTAGINLDNTVTYTPNAGFSGQDTFKYKAKDSGLVLSNEATVTITVNVPGPPAAPTNVQRALTGTPRQVEVTWTDNAVNETRYERQRCRIFFGFCTYSTLTPTLSPNTTSFTNIVPSAGTYRFRVRACNLAGCSAYATTSNIAVP